MAESVDRVAPNADTVRLESSPYLHLPEMWLHAVRPYLRNVPQPVVAPLPGTCAFGE